ncbi:hypothetical protein F4775DRAFT_258992 [Biscogniauxia sp. FL1348]|nr:hypothetical protein F4775DRAFT_258992 [Biscogniauxia sp. FL1348]
MYGQHFEIRRSCYRLPTSIATTARTTPIRTCEHRHYLPSILPPRRNIPLSVFYAMPRQIYLIEETRGREGEKNQNNPVNARRTTWPLYTTIEYFKDNTLPARGHETRFPSTSETRIRKDPFTTEIEPSKTQHKKRTRNKKSYFIMFHPGSSAHIYNLFVVFFLLQARTHSLPSGLGVCCLLCYGVKRY